MSCLNQIHSSIEGTLIDIAGVNWTLSSKSFPDMLQTFECFLQDLMLLTELHISLTEEHAGQQLKGGTKTPS